VDGIGSASWSLTFVVVFVVRGVGPLVLFVVSSI
jgi:hypothetical protein